MRSSARLLASALGLSFAISACSGGGGSSGVPFTPSAGQANATGGNATTDNVARTGGGLTLNTVDVPHTFGALAYNDLGRKSAGEQVGVSMVLAYNHQAELDAFVARVSDPHSGSYRQFLTPAQFDAYYAPTAQQEASVVSALQSAGFTITQRFANRTIVDASAPSSTVERFFATEMHSVNQGRYGRRYLNGKTATIPSAISSLVHSVSLNNLVVVRTVADQAGENAGKTPTGIPGVKSATSAAAPPSREEDATRRILATGCSGQLLKNPGFESGNVSWSTTSGVINQDSSLSYQGNWEAWLDGYSSPETDTLKQTVSIPAGCSATLTYYLWVYTNDGNSPIDTLTLSVNGKTLQSFSNATNTNGGYVQESVNLSSFAGGNATILWTSNQNGSNATDFFIDSTALTLGGGATPTPTPVPTATPTAKPTATPTPVPTTTPTHGPTASPVPTATPTHSPTPAPTPTPTATGSTNCNGASPLNGPLSNSSGTLADGIAKPFDYPVQHGCDGAGYTAAIIIDDPVNTSYLQSYLSAAGVTRTGTVTNEAVDGGGSGDDVETDLDVQTIAGLAPGANIIVYHIGSLTDQAIEDGYNLALSDGKAVAVNSSFGGCESSDTSFESGTNSIAQQGASEGVEFSASAGDTGSDECGNQDTKGVSAPAGDPYFTSIGGVNFTYNSSGVLQSITAGSSSCSGGAAGSGTCYGGGGVSTVVPLPSFQSGITGVITSGRNQPDISLPFDPVAVYTTGGFGSYIGTSWSSPASVALFLEADELHGSKLGWLNPTLYSLFSQTGYNSYYTPCTSGNIIAYSCNASQYNQAAGIGAPKGYALAKAL